MEKKPENCVETNIFTGIFQGFCQADYLTHILSFAKHHSLRRNYFRLKKILKIRMCTTSSNPVNKVDWKSFSLQWKSVNFEKGLPNSVLCFAKVNISLVPGTWYTNFFIWIQQHILLQVWEKLVMIAMFFDSKLTYLFLVHIFSYFYW